MPGRKTAQKGGKALEEKVEEIAREMGLEVKEQVEVGKRIWHQKTHPTGAGTAPASNNWWMSRGPKRKIDPAISISNPMTEQHLSGSCSSVVVIEIH